MGGAGELIFHWYPCPTPLEQKLAFNFCAFHVLARIWMESVGQVGKKIQHDDVDTIRKYVQYMMLIKSLDSCLE